MVSLRSYLARCAAGLAVTLWAGSGLAAFAAPSDSPLDRWLDSQSELKTWSADFIQTRALKALREPLRTPGRVSFQRPNRFRWELGVPAKTVAVRAADHLVVVYPRLNRAERFPLDGDATAPWRTALTLLEAGFPSSRAELLKTFRVLGQEEENGVASVALEPRASTTRRFMPRVEVSFGVNDLSLRATELQFADGSSLRNDFTHPSINPALPPEHFEPPITDGMDVVDLGESGE